MKNLFKGNQIFTKFYLCILYCSMLSLYGTTDLVPGLRRVCSRQTMGSLMPLLRTMQQTQAEAEVSIHIIMAIIYNENDI